MKNWSKILLAMFVGFGTQAQGLREKIFVQTNQSTYLAGDTLRFSAFRWANIDSMASSVLYVELLSASNVLLQEQILAIKDSLASGKFVLADTLKIGQYGIRAYTNWQRNWGDSSLYVKPFFIVPDAAATITKAKSGALKSVQFYPEGARLVEDLPSVLAFKAIDSVGRGVIIRGDVVSDNGLEAANLQTDNRGIGTCRFVPLHNQHYQARVFRQTDTLLFALPTIAPTGYVLQINHSKSDSLTVRIFIKQLSNVSQRLTLVGQANGQILFAATDSSGYQSLFLKFATNRFPTGLVHFSLFDGQNKLQCQRSVFVNHHDQPKAASAFQNDSLAIATHFLLTAAFDELIDQPQQYFENKDSDVRRLDELILSLPLSNELRQISNEPTFRIEQGLTISGHITSLDKPLVATTILALDNRTRAFYNTISDENGHFVFENITAKDSIDWTVQALDGQRKITDCVIEFDRRSCPKTQLVNHLWQITVPENISKNLATTKEATPNKTKTNKEIGLSEVTVKAKRTVHEPRKLYNADYTIDVEALKDVGSVGTDNVLRLLQARVPGLTVREYYDRATDLPKISIRIRGASSFELNNEPLILVNGIPFSEDPNDLAAISINEIARIEVTRSAAGAIMYGNRGTSGIIAITTKSAMPFDPKRANEPTKGMFRLKQAAMNTSAKVH